MSVAASFFVAVGLIAVLAYLRWALPRLEPLAATITSAALVLLGAALSVLLTPWYGLPALALVFGHIGWALPRGRSFPASSSANSTTTASAIATEPAVPTARARHDARRVMGPETLGRYRIERELGRGSMGAVYLGHDPKCGRPVAIKTIKLSREFGGAELADAHARFLREATSARRLQHPDIVAIFDAGDAQGLSFIVMEYAPGSDLRAHTLPETLLPVATVLRTLQRVALALAHAHRQGVIHRDIKPANVIFEPVSGTVKVSDFGIASVADACRTRTGMVLGTPAFMSPEQMAGSPVDSRTDLYALGVMLFQLLTGALPHRADSMAQLMYQIAHKPAPDVRSLRPELPELLANVVALALEKRPEFRYANGQQMADDLDAVIRLMSPALTADTAPSDNFNARTELSRADPRHNSVL